MATFRSWRVARWLRVSSHAIVLAACPTAAVADGWPEWRYFTSHFVEPDGRVVDATMDQKSTSEGQSYGLFFALLANDRETFDLMLRWTSDNLAGGELGKKLPAWHWGQREDGSWGVKDPNAAADGELWIAYALLEAARLWKAPAYATTARQLLARMRETEVVTAGENTWLLPGPEGFKLDNERYRLDSSYWPPFVLRYLAGVEPDGPWAAIQDSHMRIAPRLYAKGIAPDLFVIDAKGRISADPDRPEGGYDAIRVYLWAGMSGRDGAKLMKLLAPFADVVRQQGAPPESVDPPSGRVLKKFTPIGFSAAVLPFLKALGDDATYGKQFGRVQRHGIAAKVGADTAYYDQALILFGKGWADGVYRVDEAGRLLPRWAN